MLLSDFWTRQCFSYLVTYSFQRGPELTALKKQLTQEMSSARYMQRLAIQRQLDSLESYSVTLTEGLGPVNPTAIAIGRLAADSVGAQQLAATLQRASEQEYYVMCPPIYRDAFAFYNQGDELLSVLNVCFQCHFMQTDQGEHVEADMTTYDFLRTFLIQLGHPIEDEG